MLDKFFLKYEGGSNWPPRKNYPVLLGLNIFKNSQENTGTRVFF